MSELPEEELRRHFYDLMEQYVSKVEALPAAEQFQINFEMREMSNRIAKALMYDLPKLTVLCFTEERTVPAEVYILLDYLVDELGVEIAF